MITFCRSGAHRSPFLSPFGGRAVYRRRGAEGWHRGPSSCPRLCSRRQLSRLDTVCPIHLDAMASTLSKRRLI